MGVLGSRLNLLLGTVICKVDPMGVLGFRLQVTVPKVDLK